MNTEVPGGDEALASISTGLVRLHRRHYGSAPTKAKTYMFSDNVICMLKGGFTRSERTLIDKGKPGQVHDMRRRSRATMRNHSIAVVEGATDRKVTAYMSQVHTDPDIAVELFVLEAA